MMRWTAGLMVGALCGCPAPESADDAGSSTEGHGGTESPGGTDDATDGADDATDGADDATDGADATTAATDATDATDSDGDSSSGGDHLTDAHCPTPEAGPPPGTGLFIGGGGTQGRVAVTEDGARWLDTTTASHGTMAEGHSRNLIRGLTFGAGVWVLVGGHDNAYIATTCDGVNHRSDVLGTNIDGTVPPELSQFLSDVAYLGDGVFVAAGGAGTRITSTDFAQSWQVSGEFVEGHFRGIAAGNGVAVATGHAWDGNEAYISTTTNGSDWTPIQTSAGGLGPVEFGNGNFVSIGGPRCITSSDGATWTDCGVSGTLVNLAFVNDGFLVGTAEGGLWRSEDGSRWSSSEGWAPDAIAFDGARYVMAAWGTRGWGITFGQWTQTEFPTDQGLIGLAYGKVLFAP